MLTNTFVHPKEKARNGGVRISVVSRPTDKEKRYYQKRLRVEVFPFEKARENRIYLELKADDGAYLADKLMSVLGSEEKGEHKLIKVATGKVTVELFALTGDKKGLKASMQGEQGNREVFVALTLTRLSVLAEMMKTWCLTVVPQVERSRTLVETEETIEEELKEEVVEPEENVEDEEE